MINAATSAVSGNAIAFFARAGLAILSAAMDSPLSAATRAIIATPLPITNRKSSSR
ncbi:MAG TPA: hypothetical protein VNL18_10640 [Gemmatimonadales bacterium]|nr:hypothetical protein [Gemmatimonadales bacterium]